MIKKPDNNLMGFCFHFNKKCFGKKKPKKTKKNLTNCFIKCSHLLS